MMAISTRTLVEGSLAAALSVALSYLKIWNMPQGGSVTLENVPLVLFALRHGLRGGLSAGAVSGTIQLLLGGYVAHPAQALLDYPLAFASLGLAALAPRPLWAGALLGSLARFCCHVLSGVVFFASYAPEGTNVWIYAIGYNGSFMVPNLILTVLACYLLIPRLQSLR